MSDDPLEGLPPLLDVPQVAEILGCSDALVRRMIARQELQGVRLGRLQRIRKVDLARFLAGGDDVTP